MMHHTMGRGTLPGPAAGLGRPMPAMHPAVLSTPVRLDREALRFGVALRRACLAALEAELVEGCEAAAHAGDPYASASDDRSRWDRATWQRYLDAAARLESRYGPRMRRLRDDIARLERLLDLPVAA